MPSRRYDDLSGAARALDVIGERWALLVVLELLLGPKRFSDLRAGLRSVSQNVLSQRLKDLEADGVVRRARLGPPVSTHVYELTDRGRALEPVLVALSRWGAGCPVPRDATMSPAAYALMMKDTYRPSSGGAPIHARLLVDDERLDVDAADDGITVRRTQSDPSRADWPDDRDVTIAGSVDALRAVMFDGASLDESLDRGDLVVEGDRERARRLLASFEIPAEYRGA